MPLEEVDADGEGRLLVADSATSLDVRASGAVCITGSHGGGTAVLFALAAGAKAAIFNDAGIGKNDAGISGLRIADGYGMAAVAVSALSARIGDGRDTYVNGMVTHCNGSAVESGVRSGMSAREAAKLLLRWSPGGTAVSRPPSPRERPPLVLRSCEPRIVGVDSASAIDDRLSGAIVLTGSHGGAVDGRAVRAPVAAAIFNDAGIGKDQAGVGRLQLLDAQDIPGATVDCYSAEIGSARETYDSGRLSRVNECARQSGWRIGQTARSAAHSLADALERGRPPVSAEGWHG